MQIEPFFRRNFFIHTHCIKAAGSSLTLGLTAVFGSSRVLDVRRTPDLDVDSLSDQERAAICLFAGHFGYGTRGEAFAPRQPLYLATVRDPVSRFRSWYSFVASRPNHPGHRHVKGRDPTAALQAIVREKRGPIKDRQCRLLVGRRVPVMEARKHIDSAYLLCAPYQRVPEVVAMIAEVFGREVPELSTNVGRKRTTLPPETEELLLQLNENDQALYEHVSANFDAMKERAREKLQTLLAPA